MKVFKVCKVLSMLANVCVPKKSKGICSYTAYRNHRNEFQFRNWGELVAWPMSNVCKTVA